MSDRVRNRSKPRGRGGKRGRGRGRQRSTMSHSRIQKIQVSRAGFEQRANFDTRTSRLHSMTHDFLFRNVYQPSNESISQNKYSKHVPSQHSANVKSKIEKERKEAKQRRKQEKKNDHENDKASKKSKNQRTEHSQPKPTKLKRLAKKLAAQKAKQENENGDSSDNDAYGSGKYDDEWGSSLSEYDPKDNESGSDISFFEDSSDSSDDDDTKETKKNKNTLEFSTKSMRKKQEKMKNKSKKENASLKIDRSLPFFDEFNPNVGKKDGNEFESETESDSDDNSDMSQMSDFEQRRQFRKDVQRMRYERNKIAKQSKWLENKLKNNKDLFVGGLDLQGRIPGIESLSKLSQMHVNLMNRKTNSKGERLNKSILKKQTLMRGLKKRYGMNRNCLVMGTVHTIKDHFVKIGLYGGKTAILTIRDVSDVLTHEIDKLVPNDRRVSGEQLMSGRNGARMKQKPNAKTRTRNSLSIIAESFRQRNIKETLDKSKSEARYDRDAKSVIPSNYYQSVNDLPSMRYIFKRDQIVRCVITRYNNQQSSFNVSMRGSLFNRNLRMTDLVEGYPLLCCIQSIEDHGYTIDTGILAQQQNHANSSSGRKNRGGISEVAVRGFMRFEDVPLDVLKYCIMQGRYYHEMNDDDDGDDNDNNEIDEEEENARLQQSIPLGFPIETIVKSTDFASNSVTLTLDFSKYYRELSSLPRLPLMVLKPGFIVNAYVKQVMNDGLIVEFCSIYQGIILFNHIPNYIDQNWYENYRVGQKVQARIVMIDPNNDFIHLSLKEHLIHNLPLAFYAPQSNDDDNDNDNSKDTKEEKEKEKKTKRKRKMVKQEMNLKTFLPYQTVCYGKYVPKKVGDVVNGEVRHIAFNSLLLYCNQLDPSTAATDEDDNNNNNKRGQPLLKNLPQLIPVRVAQTHLPFEFQKALRAENKREKHKIETKSSRKLATLMESWEKRENINLKLLAYNPFECEYYATLRNDLISQKIMFYKDIRCGMLFECTVSHINEKDEILVTFANGLKGHISKLHCCDGSLVMKDPKPLSENEFIKSKYATGNKIKCRVLSVHVKHQNVNLSAKSQLTDGDLTSLKRVPELKNDETKEDIEMDGQSGNLTDKAAGTRLDMRVHSYDVINLNKTTLGVVFRFNDIMGYVGVHFYNGVTAIIPKNDLKKNGYLKLPSDEFYLGQVITCRVVKTDPHRRRMICSMNLNNAIDGQFGMTGVGDIHGDLARLPQHRSKLFWAKIIAKIGNVAFIVRRLDYGESSLSEERIFEDDENNTVKRIFTLGFKELQKYCILPLTHISNDSELSINMTKSNVIKPGDMVRVCEMSFINIFDESLKDSIIKHERMAQTVGLSKDQLLIKPYFDDETITFENNDISVNEISVKDANRRLGKSKFEKKKKKKNKTKQIETTYEIDPKFDDFKILSIVTAKAGIMRLFQKKIQLERFPYQTRAVNAGECVIGYVSNFFPSKKFGLWLHFSSCLQVPVAWSDMSDLDVTTVKQCVIASNGASKISDNDGTEEDDASMNGENDDDNEEPQNSELAIYQTGTLIIAKITDVSNNSNSTHGNKTIRLSMKSSDIYQHVKLSEKSFHSKSLINQYFVHFRQLRDQFIRTKLGKKEDKSNSDSDDEEEEEDDSIDETQLERLEHIREYKCQIVRSLEIGMIMKCRVCQILDDIIFVEWIFDMKVRGNSWRNPHRLRTDEVKLPEILGVISNVGDISDPNSNFSKILKIYQRRQETGIEFECNVVDIDWNMGFIKLYDPSIDVTNDHNAVNFVSKQKNHNNSRQIEKIRSKPLQMIGDFSQTMLEFGSIAYGYIIHISNYFVFVRIINEDSNIADEKRESYLGIIPIRTPYLQLPNKSKLFKIGELLRCNVLATSVFGFIICQMDYNTVRSLISNYKRDLRREQHHHQQQQLQLQLQANERDGSVTTSPKHESLSSPSSGGTKRKFDGVNDGDDDNNNLNEIDDEPPKKRQRVSLTVVTKAEEHAMEVKSAKSNVLGSLYHAVVKRGDSMHGCFIINATHCRQLRSIKGGKIRFDQLCDDYENSITLSKIIMIVLQMREYLINLLENQHNILEQQKERLENKPLKAVHIIQTHKSQQVNRFDALMNLYDSDSDDDDDEESEHKSSHTIRNKLNEMIRKQSKNLSDINALLENVKVFLKSCLTSVVILKIKNDDDIEFTAKSLFVEYCNNHAFPRYNAYQIPSAYHKIKHSNNIPIVGYINRVDFVKQAIQVFFGGCNLYGNLSFDKLINVLPFDYSEIKSTYKVGSTIISNITNFNRKQNNQGENRSGMKSIELGGISGLINLNSRYENDDIIECNKLFINEFNKICQCKKFATYCKSMENILTKNKRGKYVHRNKKTPINNCIESNLYLGQIINVEIKKVNSLFVDFELVKDNYKYFGKILRPEHTGSELITIEVGSKMNVLVMDIDYQRNLIYGSLRLALKAPKSGITEAAPSLVKQQETGIDAKLIFVSDNGYLIFQAENTNHLIVVPYRIPYLNLTPQQLQLYFPIGWQTKASVIDPVHITFDENTPFTKINDVRKGEEDSKQVDIEMNPSGKRVEDCVFLGFLPFLEDHIKSQMNQLLELQKQESNIYVDQCNQEMVIRPLNKPFDSRYSNMGQIIEKLEKEKKIGNLVCSLSNSSYNLDRKRYKSDCQSIVVELSPFMFPKIVISKPREKKAQAQPKKSKQGRKGKNKGKGKSNAKQSSEEQKKHEKEEEECKENELLWSKLIQHNGLISISLDSKILRFNNIPIKTYQRELIPAISCNTSMINIIDDRENKAAAADIEMDQNKAGNKNNESSDLRQHGVLLGEIVNVTIEKITPNGFEVSFINAGVSLHGTIDMLHIADSKQEIIHYSQNFRDYCNDYNIKIGKKYDAVVIGVGNGNNDYSLSLKSSIKGKYSKLAEILPKLPENSNTNVEKVKLDLGCNMNVKVTKIVPEYGIYVDCGKPYGVGFVHITNCIKEAAIHGDIYLNSMFKIGDIITCKLMELGKSDSNNSRATTGSNMMQLSIRHHFHTNVNESPKCVKEIQVGSMMKGIIQMIDRNLGIVVWLSRFVKGRISIKNIQKQSKNNKNDNSNSNNNSNDLSFDEILKLYKVGMFIDNARVFKLIENGSNRVEMSLVATIKTTKTTKTTANKNKKNDKQVGRVNKGKLDRLGNYRYTLETIGVGDFITVKFVRYLSKTRQILISVPRSDFRIGYLNQHNIAPKLNVKKMIKGDKIQCWVLRIEQPTNADKTNNNNKNNKNKNVAQRTRVFFTMKSKQLKFNDTSKTAVSEMERLKREKEERLHARMLRQYNKLVESENKDGVNENEDVDDVMNEKNLDSTNDVDNTIKSVFDELDDPFAAAFKDVEMSEDEVESDGDNEEDEKETGKGKATGKQGKREIDSDDDDNDNDNTPDFHPELDPSVDAFMNDDSDDEEESEDEDIDIDEEQRRLKLLSSGVDVSAINANANDNADADDDEYDFDKDDDEDVLQSSDEEADGDDMDKDAELVNLSKSLVGEAGTAGNIGDIGDEEDTKGEADVDDLLESEKREFLISQGYRNAPQSPKDFERLLVNSPNSSIIWVRYIAFYLKRHNVVKARELINRALNGHMRIDDREDKERLNIWVAWMNLEMLYGSNKVESTIKVFRQALNGNDERDTYFEFLKVLQAHKQFDIALKYFNIFLNKYNRESKIYIEFGRFLYKYYGQHSKYNLDYLLQARNLLKKGLQNLELRSQHIALISKYGWFEYKYVNHLSKVKRQEQLRHGVKKDNSGNDLISAQHDSNGKNMFEGLVNTYPHKVGIWKMYAMAEYQFGGYHVTRKKKLENARNIFERVCTIYSNNDRDSGNSKEKLGGKNNKLKFREMKWLLKEYLSFEKKFGNRSNDHKKQIDHIKQLARAYVQENRQ